MRTAVRISLVVAIAALALVPAAPASATALGCYVACDSGNYFVSGWMSEADCCGGTVAALFTCPGGGSAFAYAFESYLGPQFCS